MKKNVTFVLSILSLGLCAQTYINQMVSIGSRTTPAVYVEDSSYLMVASNFLNFKELHLGRFDKQGNLIQLKSHLFPAVNLVATCKKCLETNKGNFYVAHTHFFSNGTGTGDSTTVLFLKLDANLDTVYTRELVEFEGKEPQILDMAFDSDSTFLVSGILYRTNGFPQKEDLWVGRFDTNFVPIWQKRVEDNFPTHLGGYYADDIVVDDYGSVLVSGRYWRGTSLVTDVEYRSFAARVNRETGGLYWVKELSGPNGSYNMAALDAGHGEYAFAQMQFINFRPNNYRADTTRIRYGKLDTLGTMVWDTLYQARKERFWFTDMQKTLDGNYYLAGETGFPLYSMSAGFKFSPAGDSLWYRYYHHQDTSDISHIWSFAPTPDTGFVHFGIFIDWDNDYDPIRLQYSWLLKTDKHGCAVEGCESIGIEEMPVSNINVQVYPNPSSGKFVIEILEEDSPKEIEAKVYDGLGRLVYEAELTNNQTVIDLKTFPAGIYIVVINEEGRNVALTKLLKE